MISYNKRELAALPHVASSNQGVRTSIVLSALYLRVLIYAPHRSVPVNPSCNNRINQTNWNLYRIYNTVQSSFLNRFVVTIKINIRTPLVNAASYALPESQRLRIVFSQSPEIIQN